MVFFLQIVLILACLFYGARKGGVALGLLGGVGIVVLVFVFRLPPGKPPVDVILTIVAVVAASATLQASGGLDVLLQLAEKILRRNPKYVSILAPFTTCTLTMLCGTGHVVYTMLPIIYDVAIKNGIRPERPMAASSIASQMGIMASPVSVAVVSLVAFLAKAPAGAPVIDFVTLLSYTIPSTLVGVLMIGIFSWSRGKDLAQDPEFQALIADPESRKFVYGDTTTLLDKKLSTQQWTAMWIFIGAIVVVGVLGAAESLRPLVGGKPLSMVLTIQMFMLMAGALIIVFTKTNPTAIAKNEVFRAGMIAVVAVFGVAWMADTVFEANLPGIKSALAGVVQTLHPADLSERPRHDPVRPLGHDPHRQVRDQPQLHPAGADRRLQFLRLRLPAGARPRPGLSRLQRYSHGWSSNRSPSSRSDRSRPHCTGPVAWKIRPLRSAWRCTRAQRSQRLSA
jgi:anaerobic C4-dicarboxylate transporter DcuB